MSSLRPRERVESSSNSQSVRRETAGGPDDRRFLKPTPGLAIITYEKVPFDSPVESTSCTHGVSAHLTPSNPIPNLKPSRESHDRPHTIDRIACRSPDRGPLSIGVSQLNGEVNGEVDIGRRREGRVCVLRVVRDCQGVWMDNLMVKHDTVE